MKSVSGTGALIPHTEKRAQAANAANAANVANAADGVAAAALEAPAGSAVPRLRIDKLSAGYGRSEVVHGLDLRLAAGQSLCLIGPNGAGKPTVLNAIFSLADVSTGSLAFADAGYTPVAGRVVAADTGARWLADPAVSRLFLRT